jgi:hypothetical protein
MLPSAGSRPERGPRSRSLRLRNTPVLGNVSREPVVVACRHFRSRAGQVSEKLVGTTGAQSYGAATRVRPFRSKDEE